MKTKMYRFEAVKKDGNVLISDGEVYANEAKYVITAESEQRALELIEQEGENPDDYTLNEIGVAKDQLGRYYPESIRDARIK